MNKIVLRGIENDGRTLHYDYEVTGEWARYFRLDKPMWVEYSESIADVPDSIAVIPLLVQLLPMAWVTDAEIVVPEVDAEFYAHVAEIKQGYIAMYPRVNFGGRLTATRVVENRYEPTERTAAFFSGGVDAFSTLISHVTERPLLVTLLGSDITLGDTVGWERVHDHAVQTAAEFATENVFITSTFREFIDEGALSQLVWERAGDGWWHGFHHGIGLIGHIAPIAYTRRLRAVYIASSFTAKDAGRVTCASDPTIDNHVHLASTRTIHDGYELTRQMKVANICRYRRESGKNIALRVCWESAGGSNCCHCEKCYRTIVAIIVEGENPAAMGFQYTPELAARIKHDIEWKIDFDDVRRAYWRDIKECFVANKEAQVRYPELRFLLDMDFMQMDVDGLATKKRLHHLAARIKNRFKRML